MAPTLVAIEGWEHQIPSTCPSNFAYLYAACTYDTGVFNGGSASLKVVEDGVHVCNAAWQGFAASAARVVSVYFRVTTAPAATSNIFESDYNLVNPFYFKVTTGGVLQAVMGASTVNGPNVADSAWHRLDYRALTPNGTHTIDWQVDGAAQTQVALAGQGAENMDTFMYAGSNTTSHNLTFWCDDLLISNTSGDYPIGPHKVLAVLPDADGTHVGAADIMVNETDVDIVTPGYTTAHDLVLSVPPTTGHRVQQKAINANDYAEVLFADTAESTVWGVEGFVGVGKSSAASTNGTSRIVDIDGNTLTNIFSGNHATAGLYYYAAAIAAPGGAWTPTGLNGLKGRMGFSSDVTPNPYWHFLMLQYAVPVVVPSFACVVNTSSVA
jgi:hypothetical protein